MSDFTAHVDWIKNVCAKIPKDKTRESYVYVLWLCDTKRSFNVGSQVDFSEL